MRRVRDLPNGDVRIYLELEARRVRCRCDSSVKGERLSFLADNPHYTKRFAWYVGRRCRESTIKDVADELKLHWHTVKDLEMQYMRAQLERFGTPGPKVIGIDEISIGKGQTYRIVVSDLIRGRAIWFGGEDRKEASMRQFYDWLGEKKARGIRLVVMDMWRPFYNVAQERVPHAAILYDKFHVIKQLNEALDEVRKSEYARLQGEQRRYIKGQKYVLLLASSRPSLHHRSPARTTVTVTCGSRAGHCATAPCAARATWSVSRAHCLTTGLASCPGRHLHLNPAMDTDRHHIPPSTLVFLHAANANPLVPWRPRTITMPYKRALPAR